MSRNRFTTWLEPSPCAVVLGELNAEQWDIEA